MASGLAIVVLGLLLFAVTGQLQYVECSRVGKGSTKSTQTVKHAGFTASLIHRDKYFADEDNKFTQSEKRERDARRSRSRAQYLMSKRRLTGTTATTQAEGEARWETPLSDIQEGSYLMELSLGTPAQTFLAIADTGSDLTWLECEPCQTCTEEQCQPCSHGTFQPTASSTYGGLACDSTACEFLSDSNNAGCANGGGCEYVYGYGDGSVTSGTLSQDTITMQNVVGRGTQSLPNYWFGCSTYSDSNTSWLWVANGLVGLGRGTVSFPSQLGKDFGQKFGYCLINSAVSSTYAYSSPLYFGSDSVPATGSQLQYTPIITDKSETYYDVTCAGISLNGNRISSTGDVFIFDSGTTFTMLREEIFNALSNALQQQINTYNRTYPSDDSSFKLCYSADWMEWIGDYGRGVPKITFQFANTSGFDLQAQAAWGPYDTGVVCLAMIPIQANLNIFGEYQQVDSHVLYDLGNNQIGFTQGPCNATNTGVLIPPPPPPLPPKSAGASLATGLLSPLSLILLLLVLTQL